MMIQRDPRKTGYAPQPAHGSHDLIRIRLLRFSNLQQFFEVTTSQPPLTVTRAPVSGVVSNFFPDRLVATFNKMKLEQVV